MPAKHSIRWGAGLPQTFPQGAVDMAQVRAFAQRAEALQFDSLWAADMHLRTFPVLDSLSLLSYVAALTQRVRLGTSVLITPVHDPIQLARSLASLDQMSHGRLIVGVGLGTAARLYGRYGISTTGSVARFLEGLDLMKALWTDTDVSHRGRFWSTDRLTLHPRPVQQPHPRIWFGGRHPNVLRRAVKHGDGWMGAGISSTKDFLSHAQLVRQLLAEAGRDPSSFQIAKRIYVCLDRDGRLATQRLRQWFGEVYAGFTIAEGAGVAGTASECVEGIAAVAAGQPDLILLHPICDETEQIEAFARDVIPLL
ncbi:MAG: LLM class flavin-dependent oxidoreductase [Dehalococcoidia bacterium]|nr:LLM class flavin-dependent oxidoreductase [Dehalococcoidia bacterium]